MSRKYELEVKVRGLFDGGKLSISLAEQFYDMDFGALAQALAYDAEPIYRFRINNFHDDCGEYRSERLFRENGTLLYSRIEEQHTTLLNIERRTELWMLEDLKFVVISAVEVTDSTNRISATNRTVRTTDFDEIPNEIDIDFDELCSSLLEFSKSFSAVPMPYQEL